MKIAATIVATLALAFSLRATADFKTIDRAHEVPFELLRLPAAPTGNLLFRSCEDCELVTLRATPETRYLYNGENLELGDFRRMMYRVRGEAIRTDNAVTVLHNLETDTVVYVKVVL